jgi:hypothetical protein
MVYPWSKKPKEEEVKEEETPKKEEEVKEEETPKEEEEVKEEETPSDTETNEDSSSLILNILKLDGYKMDSGELFKAFREAGGEMEDFKNELDRLSITGKIKSDSDGNIMTVQDFKHEKSQQEEEHADETKENIEEATREKDSEGEDRAEDIEDESEEETAEVADENDSGESSAEEDEDIESIIKLKEETDNWLIDQLKNKGNGSSDEGLKAEVAKLKDRVQKLENVIKNITKAFK